MDISIHNIGPIQEFEFSIDGPGAFQLVGSKASGKSTSLRCMDALLSGKTVELSVTDGELDGKIEGLGRIIPVGSKKRPKGELEVTGFEGEKFTIEDVLDPPIKDPAKADLLRLKALSYFTKPSLQPSDFYSLVGGQKQFEELVNSAKLKDTADDCVLLATRVKSEFDLAARTAEGHRQKSEDDARALQMLIQSVPDLEAPHDAAILAKATESASAELARLQEQGRAAARAASDWEAAAGQLAELKKKKVPTLDEATKLFDSESAGHQLAVDRVGELERELQHAKHQTELASQRKESARKELDGAGRHADAIAKFEALVNRERPAAPTADDLELANLKLEDCRGKSEQGVRIRDARNAKDRQKTLYRRMEAYGKEAESLRNAAAGCMTTLADALKLKGLAVKDSADGPRLIGRCESRKTEKPVLFQELSEGEKVIAVLTELAPLLSNGDGKIGFFPVPQNSWQHCPDADRKAISELAKKLGVIVIGAQVSDGELRLERV